MAPIHAAYGTQDGYAWIGGEQGAEKRPEATGGLSGVVWSPTKASLKTRGVLTAFSESKLREKWHFMEFWSLKTTGMATPATIAGGGGAAAAPAAQHNRAAPCNLEGGALDLRRVREEGNHHEHALSQSGRKRYTKMTKQAMFSRFGDISIHRAGRKELINILETYRGRKCLVLDTALGGLLAHIIPEVGPHDAIG